MKAIVLTGKHEVSVSSFPEPEMNATAVKVAVAYCGLCGTDLHKYEGKSGSRPVSYTHLDVYKRQVQIFTDSRHICAGNTGFQRESDH